MGVRRWLAQRKRERVRDIWPILPGSERPPEGWPGWPEGKQFALVLTHDVEGQAGLDKCRQLMELEMKLGFRSCFNFIPEGGQYTASKELREELAANGFEVGVHDLCHDGKLFLTRREFRRNAPKINQYLKDWKAIGFRAGFMLHNLEWIHDLNVQYDTSTFDTDPFEPQPQGQRTIFPFWVSRSAECGVRGAECDAFGSPPFACPPPPPHCALRGPAALDSSLRIPHSSLRTSEPPSSVFPTVDRGLPVLRSSSATEGGWTVDCPPGYVELPYTLPQDSTLFLTLGERHPDIRFQKLDWVAKHGGMALVNVHPDYLRFEHEANSAVTYPVELYARFLGYARQRYGGSFWQVNPAELARWYRGTLDIERPRPKPVTHGGRFGETWQEQDCPPSDRGVLAGKRAAVVLYSDYATDPRPRRETEAMARAGMEVDVFCLCRDASQPLRERIDGVNIFRVPMKHRREGKLTYCVQYARFLLRSLEFVSRRTLMRRYQLVHVHNMPDVLVFSALLARSLGAKVLLDLHDPMPELMQSIFSLPESHRQVRLLKMLEKVSIAFAHRVVTPNSAFKERFASRSCAAEKIEIVMNSPQRDIFHADEFPPPQAPSAEREFVLMYHGLLVERHGLDLAVRAIAKLRDRLPRLKLLLYGDPTPYMAEVLRLGQTLNLENAIEFHGFKPQAEIAEAIKGINLGIIPNRLNEFTAINLPTRIFEYLAMKRPVIVPRTKGIRDYFAEDSLIFFEPGDVDDLARKIEWACLHPAEVRTTLEKGLAVYRKCQWELEEAKLLGILAGLLAPTHDRRHGVPVIARLRRICMVTYSYYQTDNRVMRYSEELARRGDTVNVLAIKNDPSQAHTEMIGQVRVSRIQCRQRKDESTRAAYLLPTLRFLIAASARLAWRQIRRPYDLVHVHNVPDFLVFAAWLPKLAGAKVILDIHDILPELYASKFKSVTGSVWTNTLKLVERMSARFADHVIISNDLWRDKYTARTGVGGRCSVFINNVDAAVFWPRARTRDDGKLIVLFPGGLQWHQGLDIGIRAFKRVAAELPNAEFHIYGDGIMKGQLMALTRELGLEPKVRFFKPLPVHQIAEIMANADLGVVPKRADSFGNEAYSTKIMEFMAVGVPVVVSNTKIDRFYFDNSVVRFFESGNDNALAEAMIELLRDEDLRWRIAARGLDYAARNSWTNHKHRYLALVDSLIEGRPPVPPDNAPPAQACSATNPATPS